MEPTTLADAVTPLAITQIVREDMKTAMRAKDAATLECVRGLLSAFTNELVTLHRMPSDTLTDAEALVVVKRAVKKGKDAAAQFTEGGRPELADKENAEVAILSKYLPAQATDAEIEAAIALKVAEMGVTDKAGVGKLIGAVTKHLNGNVDGMRVKELAEKVFA
jgi:uncharacterized protein